MYVLLISGSTVSLGMGLMFGGVLGYGAYQTTQDPNNYYISLGASAVLTGVMGNKFYKSGKFMPAGLVAAMRYKNQVYNFKTMYVMFLY
jgi:uncharacterized membrane protein (UPF0136 family)